MKKTILFIVFFTCIGNTMQAQTDSNKNKQDSVIIKLDPAHKDKKKNPDSTNERKKAPPIQKNDLINKNRNR